MFGNRSIRFIRQSNLLKSGTSLPLGMVGHFARRQEPTRQKLANLRGSDFDGNRAADELAAASKDRNCMRSIWLVVGEECFLRRPAGMPERN